jgi:hypothetical protein
MMEDEEEGPPSAPRLREGLAASAESDEAEEQGFQEDEGPLKTPPPESGRQHVAAQVAAPAESSDDSDMDISITVTETETELTPAIEAAASEPPAPEPVRAPRDAPPPLEAAPSSAVIPLPAHEARPPSSRPPPAQEARPPSTPPPVRIMAQPGPAAPMAAPVEVWASTHAPQALRGHVASFVGQNVSFVPRSFGELLDASLKLGES